MHNLFSKFISRIINLNNVIYVADALPGAGKTQSFISSLDTEYFKRSVVVALPTKILAKDIVGRLKAVQIPYKLLNSDTTKKVVHNVECALLERDELGPIVLVISHETLKAIEPEYLEGWELVVDEAPTAANNFYHLVGETIFENNFSNVVNINPVDNKATIRDGFKRKVRNLYYETISDSGLDTVNQICSALLREDSQVFVKEIDDKCGSTVMQVKAVDFHDFTKIFRFPDSVHIMGNGISKGLVYAHLESAGYEFRISEYTPNFKPYKMPAIIMPLFSGSRLSAGMLLTTPDGKTHREWVDGCQLDVRLKEVMEWLGGEKALLQAHKWCNFGLANYPNVTLTPFDTRGLNTYSDHNITIHVNHGNPDTIEAQQISLMLERMGIDHAVGSAAMRYERLNEAVIQTMTRTEIRKFDAQENITFHIVQNEALAEELGKGLKSPYVIDRSLMKDAWKSESKSNKVVNIEEARKLKAKGLSTTKIAKELGVNQSTVSRWLKAS